MARRPGPLRRWFRWLAALAAGILIVLALLVGVARLLLPLAPDYQAEIRRLAGEAAGVDLEFARLSATWPLAGPELRFYDVRVRTRDQGRQVLEAAELRVGINLIQVALERRVRPGRITLRGALVQGERLGDGTLLVNGVPLAELWQRPPSGQLPRLDLQVEEVQVRLAEAGRLVPAVAFDLAELELEIRPAGVRFEGELQPGGGLGRDLELSGRLPAALFRADGPGWAGTPAGEEWFLRATGTDLDVAQLLRLALNRPLPLASGRGDLELEAGFQGPSPVALDLSLGLANARFQEGDQPGARYEALDVALQWRRQGRDWQLEVSRLLARPPEGAARPMAATVSFGAGTAEEEPARLSVRSSRISLGDLFPLARALASAGLRAEILPATATGEVTGLELEARWGAGQPSVWEAVAQVQDLGATFPAPGPAVTGITGQLQANQQSGRLDLDGRDLLVRLPDLFRNDLRLTSATGRLGWRTGPDGWSVVGDDLRVTAPEGQARGRLALRFPTEGSPVVDLTARAQATSARAALEWLPLRKFKPNAVEWLDRAVVAGQVPRIDLTWQGPLRGFPYRDGEGRFQVQFSVTEGVLDYAPRWPRAENLAAEVTIDRWTLRSTENRATLAGVTVANAEVTVPDLLRDATVQVDGEQSVQAAALLNFLRQSPLAEALGPTLASVTAAGSLESSLQVAVPIARPRDTRVTGRFVASGAALGLRGVEFGLTDLRGRVALEDTRLFAEGVQGRFLDEPVEILLRPAEPGEAGLSHVAVMTGTTPVEKVTAAFSLPYRSQLAGTLDWQATARIPGRRSSEPLRIAVASDLRDVASTLPQPLVKAAGAVEPLDLEVRFPERNVLEVLARLERGASGALRLESGPREGWRLTRGSLRYGGPAARVPSLPGLEIAGRFRQLRFEDWLGGGEGSGSGGGQGASLRSVEVQVEEFAILGRLFRQVDLNAERTREAWNVLVDSERAAGRITVPASGGDTAPIVAVLDRLWLVEDAPGTGDGEADPRNLPPVNVDVTDFVLADMKLGRLRAEVVQRGDGLVAEPLELAGRGFRITGDALWVVENGDPARQRSELRLKLNSTDLSSTLTALGYAPVIEGRKGDAALDLVWPGGPRRDFLAVAGGRVSLSLAEGQFLAVEPGSGRFLGLLSVAALPRRLGLDFRDVLDKGLAFDDLKGEFRLDNGSAFTCNLGLEGPVADLGMVGEVDLGDRSYDQIAVARPHVSDVLAIGGAVVGGPVVGGAVLLISQIFRKPLGTLGENYYTVTGSWDKPVVTKVQRSEVDVAPFQDCERYLAEVLREIPPGVDTER